MLLLPPLVYKVPELAQHVLVLAFKGKISEGKKLLNVSKERADIYNLYYNAFIC